MELTFQVPMKYCPLFYQTLLPSPVTSTTGCCFCFGSVSSFFLKLFLHWFPVAYWALIDLGSSSFSVISFWHLTLGFSRQEYWSGVPFPYPVDHIFSELSTMTHPPWVALHSMSHGFTELDKAVVHVISKNKTGSWLWFRLWTPYSKYILKLNKVGKSTRPFRYDLNQIPYDYTLEVKNRFKGLDLIESLKNYGRIFVTLYRRQDHPQ